MIDISTLKCNDDWMYGRTCLREGWPWIVPDSMRHIHDIVQPDWNVFEWGAGGSTIYWARECASVISVEHNIEWIPRIKKMLSDRGLIADLRHIQGLPKGKKDRFKPYANEILKEPDESFDLVFVDGEASSRGWCLTNALPKIKPGGYLLLDNSDWLHREIEGFERTDYEERGLKWIGVRGNFNWFTSVLRKAE